MPAIADAVAAIGKSGKDRSPQCSILRNPEPCGGAICASSGGTGEAIAGCRAEEIQPGCFDFNFSSAEPVRTGYGGIEPGFGHGGLRKGPSRTGSSNGPADRARGH